MWGKCLLLLAATVAVQAADEPMAASAVSASWAPPSGASYCSVQGFPKNSIQVGCSYKVPGAWGCANYNSMTLWCAKEKGKPKAYYCCGSNCKMFSKPPRCDKPGPPPPPPPPADKCSYGQGKNDYNLGVKNGKRTMEVTFNNAGKDCARLDSLYKTVIRNTPNGNPCLAKGWRDGATKAYDGFQSNCISDCSGSGISTGNSLGGIYCQTAAQVAMTAASPGPTVLICNAVEQALCESTFEDYVVQNCPEVRNDNPGFFNDLMATCRITSN